MVKEPEPGLFQKESLSLTNRKNIHFEGGYHVKTLNEELPVSQYFSQGDYRKAHVWDGGMKNRIRSYNPRIIAIDSVIPSKTPVSQDLSLIEKMNLWEWLPGNPQELNNKKEIQVIMGDSVFWMAAGNLIPTLPYSASQIENLISQAISISKGQEQPRNNAVIDPENVALVSGVVASEGAIIFLSKKNGTPQTSEHKDRITRRAFMKKGLNIAGSAGLTYILAKGIGMGLLNNTGSPRLANIGQFLVEATRDRVLFDSLHTSVTGRTALLIAKSQDASSLLGQSNEATSIVMGNAHAPEAGQLLVDKTYRMQQIRKMAEGQLGIFKKVLSSYPQHDYEQIRELYLKQIQTITIAHVTEPPDTNRVSDLLNCIRKETTLVSQEVNDATSGL